jgi:hypothetical protein
MARLLASINSRLHLPRDDKTICNAGINPSQGSAQEVLAHGQDEFGEGYIRWTH